MAARAGTGMEIDLDLVPLREEGMTPYEIMLSESQERMLLVTTQACEKRVRRLFDKWDLDAAVIGRVNDSGRVRVTAGGRTVADLPASALVDDAPKYTRESARPAWQDTVSRLQAETVPEPSDGNDVLRRLLEAPNLCSREAIYQTYDHMVRTNTVVRPGSDAAVILLKGTDRALALTSDCNSRYCYLDPEEGARLAVAEAARNLACAGATPIGTTDCLNFGNPERPETMWQFTRSIAGIADACRAFDAPIIGGNVSFYNETEGKGIHPTPMIAMVGLLDDVKGAMTQWFRQEGDLIFLLGEPGGSLAASEYLALLHGQEAGLPAPVDLVRERALHDMIRGARDKGLIVSAHDCAEGGLAYALLECCITNPAGVIGAEVALDALGRLDALLFGEAPTRVILSASPASRARLEHAATEADVPIRLLGKVGGDRLGFSVGGTSVIDLEVGPACEAWRNALTGHLKGSAARD
jgi:phosphoribosylformylglycinamidine synthase